MSRVGLEEHIILKNACLELVARDFKSYSLNYFKKHSQGEIFKHFFGHF